MKQLNLVNKVGKIGEDIACNYLIKHGHKVICRNYLKKWGEIDIVSSKDGILHFTEVKAVSCESLDKISHETDDYRPEDNIHPWKLKRLSRVIQSYLLETYNEAEPEWQFGFITVYLDSVNKRARVSFESDVVL